MSPPVIIDERGAAKAGAPPALLTRLRNALARGAWSEAVGAAVALRAFARRNQLEVLAAMTEALLSQLDTLEHPADRAERLGVQVEFERNRIARIIRAGSVPTEYQWGALASVERRLRDAQRHAERAQSVPRRPLPRVATIPRPPTPPRRNQRGSNPRPRACQAQVSAEARHGDD